MTAGLTICGANKLNKIETALSDTMRSSMVFFLAVSFAMFEFGVSLQCHSCPQGSSEKCEATEECSQGDDSCLKLSSDGKTYTSCVRQADCDFRILGARYPLPNFTFSCCQSNLCNGESKSFFQKFKDFFG
ncbi:CD59 glycoprotein-like [Scomber scombrus]|uniref:CD59 glycoprotein-like n=1 Tax=Scomber scombrus TaxID=13677 RepID=UPI002DDAE9BC|nr:CD59 glycoprotein-like [Scomber scombrus]